MLSDATIRFLAEAFCGDTQDFYSYKKGYELVTFFNQYFGYKDVYQQGFPSRWAYTYNMIVDLINKSQIDNFLSLILSKNFVMRDMQLNEAKSIEFINEILPRLNERLKQDQHIIVKKNDKYCLVKEDEDLIRIGGGGFATVYRRKSTGVTVKKLKDEYISDSGIRSRFKREFYITQSLKDIIGIITVFDFYEDNYSYTMEAAEQTLYDFITQNDLPEPNKIICIRQVLSVMEQVHKRDVIHRDISPTNILLFSGMLKISDFGLGKDLNALASHQTIKTNAFGQFAYCAPEQTQMLKDGDKRSDVYSLGKLINFIMTEDPNNMHHFLRTVIEKATNQNPDFRYKDAGELLKSLEQCIKYHQDKDRIKIIKQKILGNILDTDVENYIYELSGELLCSAIISDGKVFANILLRFMKESEERSLHIIQSIEDSFRDVCMTWESHDPIASFAYSILMDKFSFVPKELAARILHYIARETNRYNAQRLIESAIATGIEPTLEDILNS